MMGARTPEQVQAILSYIQPESLNYDDWLHIGMALKNEGYPFEIWDGWSVDDDHAKERPGKWDGFQSDSAYRMGTIIEKARQNNCPESVLFPNKTNSANAVPAPIVTETVSVLKPQSDGISLQILESCVNLGPQDQQKAFIKALFLPEEFICYESSDSEKKGFPGKYEPKQMNRRKTMTARDFVNAIEQNDSSAWDNYFQPAGMWICINPTDGKGRTIKNIEKKWRHVLVESDEMDPKKQLDFLKNSGLPISAIYSSGSRSIHAAVCVNASNQEQYKARSAKVFEWCESQGFKIDKATKNTNQLTRFPGFYRGDQLQTLFYVGTAKPYEQWEAEAFREPQGEPNALPTGADYETKRVKWLIPGAIPAQTFTLLGGEGGTGKSTLLCNIIAGLIRGRPTALEWNLENPNPARPPMRVMLFSSEDDFQAITKPRLKALGCTEEDLKRLYVLPNTDKRFPDIKYNSELLFSWIKQIKPALIVFDPLQAFLPDSVDMSRRNQMRNIFQSLLSHLDGDTAVLILMHCNKNQSLYGLNKLADSKDITDIARSVFLMGYTGDKHDGAPLRYLSHEKSSYARPLDTIEYVTRPFATETGDSLGVFLPIQRTDLKDYDYAASKMNFRKAEKEPKISKTDLAMDFILSCIKGDVTERGAIAKKMKEELPEISEPTFKRALKALKDNEEIETIVSGTRENKIVSFRRL